ncbi:hypothetical protein AN639_03270 [Candidatus Epulonipiscium fishelsonii]|uniref:Uncharacterized protein n=1 Tax=Candidatus Epulonipiscium fishelsonii TaxID=77094 RepID=A0ACC8XGJ3_9FIRM|nr:hypothetical protein AN639_03270 [Epulopiscium sp. SCG-B05WGA-EpuloA1]ONI42637.1 hypothetical protein AN396_13725 [Epulopiscium sp. SCG-B11WGA-EpuloA1]ONI47263.1 hypothetical protein AN644_01005 [Epulopiscium sp. SCG-C06WGA-EpuloA1]
MKTIFGIICFIFILVGCEKKEEALLSEPVTYIEETSREEILNVYINEEVSLEAYEPIEGVYLGAFAEKNKDLNNDIINFEQAIGQEQAFRVFQYTKAQSINTQDILSCVANKQVPYIKYLLDENSSPKVYEFINDVGAVYSTPLFIELYPVTENITNPTAYKQQYQETYDLIKNYLPNATIVWSMDYTRIQDWAGYYPGNYMVDWVGLNIYLPRYKEETLFNEDISDVIDMWYKTFQEKKPMMISSLAISHFSNVDYTYIIADAKNKLKYFYQDIPQKYPRIKGILYIDINMQDLGGTDDYRVSIQSELAEYINQLTTNPLFLHEIKSEIDLNAKQYITYTLPILVYNNKHYLSEIYASQVFDSKSLNQVNAFKDLEGAIYYPLEDMQAYADFYF